MDIAAGFLFGFVAAMSFALFCETPLLAAKRRQLAELQELIVERNSELAREIARHDGGDQWMV